MGSWSIKYELLFHQYLEFFLHGLAILSSVGLGHWYIIIKIFFGRKVMQISKHVPLRNRLSVFNTLIFFLVTTETTRTACCVWVLQTHPRIDLKIIQISFSVKMWHCCFPILSFFLSKVLKILSQIIRGYTRSTEWNWLQVVLEDTWMVAWWGTVCNNETVCNNLLQSVARMATLCNKKICCYIA